MRLPGTRTLTSEVAACNFRPTLVMGALPPQLTYPSQGCLNVAAELLLPVGRSSYFSSHPTVLASQVAWITAETILLFKSVPVPGTVPIFSFNLCKNCHNLSQLCHLRTSLSHSNSPEPEPVHFHRLRLHNTRDRFPSQSLP